MGLSILEGGFYAVMVGCGEVYFVANGVRLGATPWMLGLLVGLPLAVGGLAAAGGARLLHLVPRRRPLLAGVVFVQALLLFGLSLLERLAWSSPTWLLIAVCLYQACGQLAGALWSSWYGDLVPAASRGRYFSRRSRVVQTVTFAALVTGGLWLYHGEPGGGPVDAVLGGRGFLGLFLAAGVARLISAALLVVSPEPPFERSDRPLGIFRHLRSREGAAAGRVLGIACLMNFGVYLGSPYFAPFMLEQLRLDYRTYMLATAVQVAVKVVSLRPFGVAMDNYGPAPVYKLAVLLVALIPVPWLLLDGLPGVLLAQAFSGFAWAAHEVGVLGLLLSASQPTTRPAVFAAQSLLNGHGQLLGSATGAGVLHTMGDSYRAVFAASLVGRVVIALAAPFVLRAHVEPLGPGRGRLLLRVIGFRPSGGVVHRPILEPADVADDESRAHLGER